MQPSPRPARRALAAVTAAVLLVGSFSSARAETFRFPGNDPVFSITFPDSWKTKLDLKDHTLSSQPAPDRACVLTLGEMENVDDLTDARTALPKFVANMAKGVGIKDLQATQEPLEVKSPRGVRMVMAEFRGTTATGVKMVLTTVAFQPGEDADVFILTGAASEEENQKVDQESTAIVESITPV